MELDRVLGLFKFGQRAHIDDFVRGCLYMNPLRYFVEVENSDPRYDGREGQGFWLQSDRVTFSVMIDGEYKPIPGLFGPIACANPENLNVNVFCLYALRASAKDLVDPRNFTFGDVFAVLKDGDEFLRRVRRAAERAALDVDIRMVEYVNEREHHGEMGTFRKSSEFEYQSELRIAVTPGTGSPYRFEVGDLADITLTGPLADLNRLIKVE